MSTQVERNAREAKAEANLIITEVLEQYSITFENIPREAIDTITSFVREVAHETGSKAFVSGYNMALRHERERPGKTTELIHKSTP